MKFPTVLCMAGLALAAPMAALAQEPGSRADIDPSAVPMPRVYLPGARDPDPIRTARAPRARDAEQMKRTAVPWQRSVGLRPERDGILGEGPSYQIRFRSDGFTFTPPPVASAPVDVQLRFRLQSVTRRGAAAGHTAAAVAPVSAADGKTVRYPRDGFVECYELRPDGVEQSFVFSSLPPGGGDLVVRGVVETALPLARAAADEVRFEVDGLGVRIGRVLGIDANGVEAAGTFSYDDGVLELSLPAAFVDHAALPLVLDPLIGSRIPIAVGTTYTETYPDVACHYGSSLPGDTTYLVVWERTGFGIRGQRLDLDGTTVGRTIFIRDGSVFAPRVAPITVSGAFAVVWQEGTDIMGTAVDVMTGAVSIPIAIAGTPDFESSADVGGTVPYPGWTDDAIVVWENITQDRIEAAQFEVHRTTGVLRAHDHTNITSGTTSVQAPAISKTSGRGGTHLIVWQRDSLGISESDISGAIVDRDLTFLTTLAITNSQFDEDDPAVDGNGSCWVVAYETETDSGSGDNDIACRGVCLDAGFEVSLTPEVMVEAGLDDDEINPAVAWLGETALVAHADETSPGVYDMYAVTVDAFDCTRCEGRFQLDVALTDDDFPRIASRNLGGTSLHERALIVWESRNTGTADRDIDGWLFEPADGGVLDLGGGCLAGGTAHASCAITGNSDFDISLVNAAPSAACWLVLSPDEGRFGCGSCQLVPDPFFGFVAPVGTTDSHGNAAIPVSIPSSSALVGASFYLQWLVAGSGCFGFDFSNGLRVVIQ